MKRSFYIFIVILLFAALVFVLRFISIPYHVHSIGMLMPASEYVLRIPGNGTISAVFIDYKENITQRTLFTEFNRGDFAEFFLDPNFGSHKLIKKGDTIGVIRSLIEEIRLNELRAELEVQKSLLSMHSSGEKKETISLAEEKIKRATHEYETQQKLTSRSEILFNEGYIPAEEYEISLNNYLRSLQNLNIEKAELDVLRTGAKPEYLDYLKSNIHSIELQTEQLERKLNAYHLKSPIDGVVVEKRAQQLPGETTITIADYSETLLLIPVEVYQLKWIKPGQEVSINSQNIRASITGIDNVVQMVDQRQKVFVTALISEPAIEIMPGAIAEAVINCGEISVLTYLKRLLKVVYSN
jgi:hypothetical protein